MEGPPRISPVKSAPQMLDKLSTHDPSAPLKSKDAKKTPKSKGKPLYFWDSADVNKWLKKHGGHCHCLYGDLFLEHDVTGRTLIRLNDLKLEKMGITNPVHKCDIMRQILQQRLRHEAVEAKTLDQKRAGFELKLPEAKVSKDLKIPDTKISKDLKIPDTATSKSVLSQS